MTTEESIIEIIEHRAEQGEDVSHLLSVYAPNVQVKCIGRRVEDKKNGRNYCYKVEVSNINNDKSFTFNFHDSIHNYYTHERTPEAEMFGSVILDIQMVEQTRGQDDFIANYFDSDNVSRMRGVRAYNLICSQREQLKDIFTEETIARLKAIYSNM